MLAAATASATSPAAPQPAQAEDYPFPATTDCGGTTSSTNFLILLPGQLVLEVMFILLIVVLLVPHAQQSPFLFMKRLVVYFTLKK